MILAVIPARYASTRFPGKPLIHIGDKTMIRRVYEQVAQCASVTHQVVATDDARIYEEVRSWGGEVLMTRPDHSSGTDRCAEVTRRYPQAQAIINVQGDEPFIQPQQIDLLTHTLLADRRTAIATLVKKIETPDALFNPNIVKAAFAENTSQALYFSRHPIPYLRGIPESDWLTRHTFYRHIGLYGFRRNTLLRIARLSPTPLEQAESLEQLRWLEHGFRIRVAITTLETVGIDTPEDLEKLQHTMI